ncbi:MAG: chromosome partition protein Smc [Alphaproteobacteria bacterium]|nr:MAG: chromosome partition protein Smc [Alphaproteobacteria bacterium]
MKFKSIRISGFKSFLEPTEIDLNEGLTGIVGPNGCGKSNIVEAMKWVMGENSARQMRGEGMDDVIFSGSNERPARNFAEVTIKLDNTEKKAPASFNQFDEIEISRKIEREKGSTYRVNSKQVRARDVQLIFADTATGARSSGIVSQGRISQIIESSLEERRIILEEAANIKGLHNRRHEAELKLNGATDNLSRLLDIENTYNEQLIELEKQGRKAARYRSVGDRLRKAEASLFLSLLNTAEKEFDELETKFEKSKNNVEEAQINLSKNTKSKLEIFNKLPELRKIETEKAAILQSLNISKIRLEEEEATSKFTLNNVLNQITQIETDIKREIEIKDDANKTIANLLLEKDKLQLDTKDFTTKKNDASKKVNELKIKSEDADAKLSSINSEIFSIKSDKSDLENRINNLKEKIKNSVDQKSQFNIAEDKKLIDEHDKKRINIEKLIKEENNKLELIKKQLENKENLNINLKEKKAKIDYDLNVMRADLHSLSSLLGYDEFKNNTLEATIDDIGNLQDAIGSVLGETILAPVKSDSSDEQNISYWKEITAKFEEKLPKGATPIISKIKKNSILDIALIGIGIVENEKTALKLQKELSFGQALTTLKGGLWRWDGYVQPLGVQNSYSERLQQITKLRNLQDELPTKEKEEVTIVNEINKNELELKKFFETTREIESKISLLNNELNDTKLSISSLDSKINSSTILLKEHQNILDTSQKELVDLEKLSEKSVNLPTLLADELKIRNAADQCRNELTDAMAAEQQIRNQESYQQRNLMQINNQKNDWENRKDEAETRIKSLKVRLDNLKEDKSRLEKLPDNFVEKANELNIKIETAEQNRNFAADKLVQTETLLNEAEKLEKSSEQNLASFREDMIKVEASLNLAKTKIENIEDRVYEKLRVKSNQLKEIVNLSDNEELNTSIETLEKTVQRLLNERESLGAVNLRAEEEMNEMRQKIELMSKERVDLELAIEKLKSGIFELNKEGRQRLKNSFELVNKNFKNLFKKLFGGGDAELKLVGDDDPLKAGLEILASPPGKKMQLLSLLSGGEQALTAISLIFSVFLCNPAPICILDEVDAALDDSNVSRFCNLLDKIVDETETYFLVVTHHRLTMAKMNRLFGVTMEQKGISRLVSVDLEQANKIKDIA